MENNHRGQFTSLRRTSTYDLNLLKNNVYLEAKNKNTGKKSDYLTYEVIAYDTMFDQQDISKPIEKEFISLICKSCPADLIYQVQPDFWSSQCNSLTNTL